MDGLGGCPGGVATSTARATAVRVAKGPWETGAGEGWARTRSLEVERRLISGRSERHTEPE